MEIDIDFIINFQEKLISDWFLLFLLTPILQMFANKWDQTWLAQKAYNICTYEKQQWANFSYCS